MITIEERLAVMLKTSHTKTLMGYLEIARKCGGFYSPFDNEYGFTVFELKDELSTREHIPNKEESRRIRQEKARKK